ncbi:hypothetical protein C1I98_30555 [Spongiactinospora gelatinilytica]|uniref:Uncharacterized protein n=1 Tax=Spongiactinospora gelatinilytica TaxID=2666298 RepID=A0A2W2GVU2_9ACTN|nr:DUF5682 family protein [Spongiactinospora gelatinilytica]PZG31004.1 hypothetical protein C1I98_30555 [Spongiactinospora gelatinilytica]
MPAEPALLGVRHHGPGSARAVRAELARLRPDIVLIEGPPEADPLVALAGDPAMEPPVALLAHVPGEPAKSAFWPFARFSPEWQAIRHALGAGVPVRFCDLPAAAMFATAGTEEAEDTDDTAPADPIGSLAAAAGYDDPERWWEDMVEHRAGATPFEVIAEAMAAVRDGHAPGPREALREAHMRRAVRRARKDGFERIAVVCGAWHVPALAAPITAKADDATLRGLPKAKVEITWVPWTYGRLATFSGYGAGVTSPGWYDHLFAAPDRPVERWLAGAAGVLREEGLAVSSAHVIESVRLAEGLAVLRGRPLAGLGEVTEAARAVLCEGDDLPVELIQRRMVVGERLGAVPDDTPMVPLQRHLREEQRRLKLKPEALDRDLDLDLRKPLDLGRSVLLHRLRLLGVPWGTARESRGKGTFRESWTLVWRPEFDVELIEASAWGTTVGAAAAAKARDLMTREGVTLADLTETLEACLLADLGEALPYALDALAQRAALDPDVTHLMAAVPATARALRYGDVRGTPAEGLGKVAGSMLARIRAGLSPALTGLDDPAAKEMIGHLDAVHAATGLLPEAERDAWLAALHGVAGRGDLHGRIDGRLTRMLLDAGSFDGEETARRMALATSAGHSPARVASWVEGFLAGGGLLLVHDAQLLRLVDRWLSGLSGTAFVDVLPLLRRTFATFDAPERRAIGERVRNVGRAGAGGRDEAALEIDEELAAGAVATVLAILGRSG